MINDKEDRFDYVDGQLDDVVIHDVSVFRLERLDDGSIWMACYRDGQRQRVVINLNSAALIEAEHVFEPTVIQERNSDHE